MSDAVDDAERAFAANLRDARIHAGVSQEVLAGQMRKLGYESWRQNTVYRLETGSRGVRLGEALALCSLLGSGLEMLPAPRVAILMEAVAVRAAASALEETRAHLQETRGQLEIAAARLRKAAQDL